MLSVGVSSLCFKQSIRPLPMVCVLVWWYQTLFVTVTMETKCLLDIDNDLFERFIRQTWKFENIVWVKCMILSIALQSASVLSIALQSARVLWIDFWTIALNKNCLHQMCVNNVCIDLSLSTYIYHFVYMTRAHTGVQTIKDLYVLIFCLFHNYLNKQ